MNTQTHLLLGLAAFSRRSPDGTRPSSTRAVEFALLGGAFLPDASLFVMWGYAKLTGVPDRVIWGELYYSPLWQDIGAFTNSMPIYLTLALAAWFAGGRLLGEAARARPLPSIGLAVAVSAMLHVVTDLPLHHNDGHPHFWPFSDWIFSSPISYWDPRYHGTQWRVFESALAVVLVVILWRRFRSAWARVPLVAVALSYGAMTAYWTMSLGG